MAALRLSVLAMCFLCSCAHSQPQENIKVESKVEDCFTFSKIVLDDSKELLLLTASIGDKTSTGNCPCKSALLKYNAYQNKDGNNFYLLSGQFSILGKDKVTLPIAVQKQLIFLTLPFICRWPAPTINTWDSYKQKDRPKLSLPTASVAHHRFHDAT